MGVLVEPSPRGLTKSAGGLYYDARSSWLLQGSAPPANDGEQQPFPSTAAALLAAMGNPAGITPLGGYLCDTATPLVSSWGTAPNLVAANGPLTGREGVGLPTTSFNSKLVAETLGGTDRFAVAADATFGDPNGGIVSILLVVRFRNPLTANARVISKRGGAGAWYDCYFNTATEIDISISLGGGVNIVGNDWLTGSWHNLVLNFNDVAKYFNMRSDLGDTGNAAYAGLLSGGSMLSLGSWYIGAVSNQPAQYAYMAVCQGEITSAMRQAFWRAYNLNEFQTPVAYTRAGPLVVPATASRVACFGTNQPAVGYNANFVAGTDNALQVGSVHEDAITFEPIGSTDFYTNSTAWNVALARVDGPSGMRDAMRVTMAAGWWGGAGLTPVASVAIAGASNVPWRADVDYRRATVGTTGQMAIQFAGSGGGPEVFSLLASAATPVDWARGGGTCTPVNADQTSFQILTGATNNGNDCDFGEPAVVKNRTTAPLAWRRVGTAAAAATATPVTSITNVGNVRYDPRRGKLLVRFAGMPAAISGLETLLCFGAYPSAGNLVLTRAAGNLSLWIRDASNAVVVSFNTTVALTANVEHNITIEWDAYSGFARISEGGVVHGQQIVAGGWNPCLTDVTPLYVACGTGGLAAARNWTALIQPVLPAPVAPATLLTLDSRSPYLLQGDAPPAQPGEQQPFPATAAALLAALGAPAGITPLAAYLCDSASPEVASFGGGPNLAAGGAGQLTGREAVGLPASSFNAKLAVEFTTTNDYFAEAAHSGFAEIAAGQRRTFLAVARINPAADAGGIRTLACLNAATNAWYIANTVAHKWIAYIYNPGAATSAAAAVVNDGAWGWVALTVDCVANQFQLLSDTGNGLLTAFAGANPITDATSRLQLGLALGAGGSLMSQITYFAILDGIVPAANLASFWRAFNLNEWGTIAPAYTRAGPLVVPITASRVACYGANQPAVAYNANASAGTNPLQTGVPCEEAITFEPVGSTDFYTNTTVGAGGVKASVDGPSGMRDGVRYTMGGAWRVWAGYLAGFPIVGASNVPWRADVDYRRATVNTTGRMGLYFGGSAGGAETFTLISDAATPVDWVRGGGTCTPVNADQTSLYFEFGAAALNDNCDFGEPAVVKNRTTVPLGWRRVGTAAAAATATPVLSYTNVGNARYNPARGREIVRVCGFAGPGTPTVPAGSPYAVGAGAGPHDILADGLYQVWSINNNNSTLSVYNAVTKVLRSTFATGNHPAHGCADLLGQVWITCDGANKVYVYDAATLAAVGNYATGNNPWGIAADGLGQIWVANFNGNTVTVFDARTKAVVGTYATLAGPRGVAVDDQGQVWVVCQTAGQVRCFNATTHAVVGDYAVGAGPWFASCDRSNQVWIANTGTNTVTVYNTITKALVGTYTMGAAGSHPSGMGVDAFGRIWISLFVSNLIYVVDVVTKATVMVLASGTNPNCVTMDALGQAWGVIYNGGAGTTIQAWRTCPTFLDFGGEGVQGALRLDYRGVLTLAPLFLSVAKLGLRIWDDASALVYDLAGDVLTAASEERTIEWDAAVGIMGIFNGATAYGRGGVWTPEPLDVAPLYVGSDAAGTNAARAFVNLLLGYTR